MWLVVSHVCCSGCVRFPPAVILSQYHADSGGSFEIVSLQGARGPGGALMQMSPLYPSLTDWVPDYDPITSLGDVNWTVTRSARNVAVLHEHAYRRNIR